MKGKYYKNIGSIFLCCVFVFSVIFPTLYYAQAIGAEEFTEDFETVSSINETAYISPNGTAEITEQNVVSGNKSLNVTANGYYQQLLKLEKKTLKANTQYTVKISLKHMSGNAKYAFRVVGTDEKELEYYEFWANNGSYCWGNVNNLQASYNALNGSGVEMTFTFTPDTAAYFMVWSCQNSTSVIFDDIIITPNEFNETDTEKSEFSETFETAGSLDDTVYISPNGTVEITEQNAVSGNKSLKVTANGYYQQLLKLEKKTLKANTQYTVKISLRHLSGNVKYGFRVLGTEGKELEYYEFWANNGAYCYSTVKTLQASYKALTNGGVEMTFTFTPETAAYFTVWSCQNSTSVIFDDIIITPNEFNETDSEKDGFTENFEDAETVEGTAYISPHGITEVTQENKIAGNKSLKVTANGYYQQLLKLEKKTFKADTQYTVKISLKHMSDNAKYAFRVVGTDEKELEYYEFWANNGQYCWGSVNNLQVSYKNLSNGAVEMIFTFTPNTASYFMLWSCEGNTAVMFDDIIITPNDLNEVEPKLEGYVEHFEGIESVDDTIFNTSGLAELTEESIVRIGTDGYYQEMFALDSSNNLLKAGTDYKIKFKYKYESGETKWGFKLTSEFGEELEYYEFFANTGSWCFGGSDRLNVSYRNMADGYIEITFAFTPSKNAYFCLWATYTASAYFDYICITPDEMLPPTEIEVPENAIFIDFEDIKNVSETDILTSSAPTAVVTEEECISGNKSLMVAISERYSALVETDSSKVMLKAGTRYTFTTKIKYCSGAKNIGIRFLKYNGEEMKGGYMEFDSTTGAKGWAPAECDIEYIGKTLPNGIVQVQITFTPLENSMLMLWSSSESKEQTKIIFDEFSISPDDLSKVIVSDGSLWSENDTVFKTEWQESYLLGKISEDFEKAGKMSDTAFTTDDNHAHIIRNGAIGGEYSLSVNTEKQNIIALDDSYFRLKKGVHYSVGFNYKLTGENSDYSMRMIAPDGKLIEELVFSPSTLQTVKEAKGIKIKNGRLNGGVGYIEFVISPSSDCIFGLYAEKSSLLIDDIAVSPTAPDTEIKAEETVNNSDKVADSVEKNQVVQEVVTKPVTTKVKYVSDIEFGKAPITLSIILLSELAALSGICSVTVVLIRKKNKK